MIGENPLDRVPVMLDASYQPCMHLSVATEPLNQRAKGPRPIAKAKAKVDLIRGV